ncbi:MAG TPA: hypothetical protein VK923_19850 [Euzebyales bacterium]|nr:hypothetical protein [Euzebyales bacterium]
MIAAFGWGALGGSALLVGALIAYLLAPSRRMIALVTALGTGVLIGSVSFELVEEALETQTVGWVALLVLVGAAVFTIGDWLLERRGGSGRKDPSGAQAEGSPLAIVLGSVLDGIPESFVLGLTVLQGGVEPVAARRRRAVEPARGNVVVQRPEGGRMAPGPGGADVVGGRGGLRGVRSGRVPAAGPRKRAHRGAGAGVRGRRSAGQPLDVHKPGARTSAVACHACDR